MIHGIAKGRTAKPDMDPAERDYYDPDYVPEVKKRRLDRRSHGCETVSLIKIINDAEIARQLMKRYRGKAKEGASAPSGETTSSAG